VPPAACRLPRATAVSARERDRGVHVLVHVVERGEPLAFEQDELRGARARPRRQRRERAVERAPNLVPDERGGEPLAPFAHAGFPGARAPRIAAVQVGVEDQSDLPVVLGSGYPSHEISHLGRGSGAGDHPPPTGD
jgi:hypothetical protein